MIYRSLLALLLILLCQPVLQAQSFWDTWEKNKSAEPSFSEMETAFHQWQAAKDRSQEKGWKYLGRWFDYQAKHLDGAGQNPSAQTVNAAYRDAQAQKVASMQKTSASGWVPVGPFGYGLPVDPYDVEGVGRINSMTFHPTDPQTYWVAVAQGGVWKTTDDGASWIPLTDDLPTLRVSDIAVQTNNPDVMYISSGDYGYIGVALETDDRKRHTHYGLGIFKTIDGGATWTPTGLSHVQTDFDGSLMRRVLISTSNANELLAAGTSGVWKSFDAGTTWLHINDSLVWDMERDPNNPNTIYLTTGYLATRNQGTAAIFKSTNFGNTWTKLNSGIPATGAVQRIEITVSPANTNYVYALTTGLDRGFYALYRSTDAGATWSQQSNSPNILGWYDGFSTGGQGPYDLVVVADPNNAQKVFVGGVNWWGSTDGGVTWDGCSHWTHSWGRSIHADQHYAAFHPTNGKLYVCNDGGLWSTNQLIIGSWNDAQAVPGYTWPTQWNKHSEGMNATSFYRVSVSEGNPTHVIAGAQDNSTWYYDGGLGWVQVIGGDGMDCILHPSNPGQFWGMWQYGGMANSYDGGLTINYSLNSSIFELGEWTTPIELNPGNPSELYAGYQNIWKSDDDGFNWTQLSAFPSIPSMGAPALTTSLAIAPSSPATIWAARRLNRFYNVPSAVTRSTDGGSTWSSYPAGYPDSLYITDIETDHANPDVAWITLAGFESGEKVYKTTNGGLTWSNITQNLPNLPVNTVVLHQNNAHHPVYVGTDYGVWYTNDTLGQWEPYMTDLPSVIVSDLQILYATEEIFAATFGRSIWKAELRDNIASAVASPENKIRFDAFPNPNQGSFTVEIEGNLPATLPATLLDGTGKTIYQTDLAAQGGTIRQNFDLKLPAGIYFLRILTPQGTISKKITVNH